jgi:hypothetical protein
MGTYFDLLPEDILLILLKNSKQLKEVTLQFKKVYDDTMKRLSKGIFNPKDYFKITGYNRYIVLHNNEYYKINLNDKPVNYDIIDIINKFIQRPSSIVYYSDEIRDWSGYIKLICQVDIELCDELSNIDINKSGTCYVYINADWNSIGGHTDIYISDNWKDFWNMKLDIHIRNMILWFNGWI